MSIILIRHPVVAMSGRCYGRFDIDVAPDTLAQATQTLQDHQHQPIWCSPARRCLQLAERLSNDVTIVPALQELDFGCWEGLSWDEIPRHELDGWAANLWDYQVGGAESVRMLQQRVQQAFAQAKAQPNPLIWITHAGVIRTLLADLGQIAESDRWHAPIAYATPYLVE
jgi:alpha-ribazole phosphatase